MSVGRGANLTAGDSDVSGLIAHIQSGMEQQKALLARELHDELGGLLVGAVMDLAWAEQHLSAPPAELKQKLTRARQTLAAAIDLKRKLIEDLRPTLLDNVGLFAALRWFVQAACTRRDLVCNIRVPDEELFFLPNVPIALFRIVQEAFTVIAARKPLASAEVNVTLTNQALEIEIVAQAATVDGTAALQEASSAETHCLEAVEQRVASLGGQFASELPVAGRTRMTARVPLDRVMLPA